MGIGRLITYGILTGWMIYFITVLISQSMLENRINEVRVFYKLFQDDPSLSATVKHKVDLENFGTFTENNSGFMSWRILQNLNIISKQDRLKQASEYCITSMNSILNRSSVEELSGMTGIELIYEILSIQGKKENSPEQKAKIMEYLGSSIAGSPMAYEQYRHHIQTDKELGAGFKKFLAYLIPPEISSPFWQEERLNDILSLSYTHLGVSKEIGELDPNNLEQFAAYNQFNDMMLKLMIMVYNDDEVIAARDRLMVFKGLVQWLILMTFFVALFLVIFQDFTTEANDRLLDLLKTMLPTLGFIGTILGLMRSLGDAYKIPIASGDANTSLAISEITTSLSVAFSTTLLAFVLLIIVDVIRIYKLRLS